MKSSRHASLERLIGPVSRETFQALLHFEQLFVKWSARINLTSASTLPIFWERHILDSAQLLRLGSPAARSWADFGSGGGFPGAVIAILLRDRIDVRVDLVESNAKKAAFLKITMAETSKVAQVHPIRVENAARLLLRPDVITARAFAPLGRLFEYSAPWLSAGTRGLFHKGRDYRKELQETGDEWHFKLLEHPSAVQEDAVVLEISDLRRLTPEDKRIVRN